MCVSTIQLTNDQRENLLNALCKAISIIKEKHPKEIDIVKKANKYRVFLSIKGEPTLTINDINETETIINFRGSI